MLSVFKPDLVHLFSYLLLLQSVVQCISSNNGDVIKGYVAQCYVEDQLIDLPFLRGNPCIQCFCQGGQIECSRKTCENIECKGVLKRVPNQCCRVCKDPDVCTYKGRDYQSGDSWYEKGCHECKCTKGTVTCDKQVCSNSVKLTCPLGMKADRVPGGCCQKCVPATEMCSSFGDPHYQTFDGKMFNFQGTCKYLLASDCRNHTFSVRVRNEARHSRMYTWTKSMFVVYRGVAIGFHTGRKVKVDGKKVALPYYNLPYFHIYEEDYLVNIVTDIGLKVSWDGDSYIEVHLPKTFMGSTCGLCGNYNNDPWDDMKMKNGMITESVKKFGASWKIGGETKCSNKMEQVRPKRHHNPCSNTYSLMRSHSKCRALKSKVFTSCHKIVDPLPYYRSCVTDMCECPPGMLCVCEALTAYARACKQKGVEIKWRSKTLCGVQCFGRSVYDECGPACPLTCKNKEDANKVCLKPCIPGCQCPAGTVWHKNLCIPFTKCPS